MSSLSCSILHPNPIHPIHPSTYSLRCDIRLRRCYYLPFTGFPKDFLTVLPIAFVQFALFLSFFKFSFLKGKIMDAIVLNECFQMRFIHVIKFAQNIQYYEG